MLGYSGKPTSWGCIVKKLLDLAQADSRLITTNSLCHFEYHSLYKLPLYVSQSTADLLLRAKFREQISLDLKKSTDISDP